MKKKKIVYLIGKLQIGGAQRYCVETATRIDREAFEAKIYCLLGDGPLKTEAEERGIAVSTFETTRQSPGGAKLIPFWRSRVFWALYRYIKCEQPDIVHCYMYTPSIYGGFAAKMAGVPVLITNRTSLGFFKDNKPHYQMTENLVNRFTDRVIVNSLAEKHHVLQQENIDSDRIYLVYNGVALDTYHPANKTGGRSSEGLREKRELGIPNNAPVIGMLANLRDCKGYKEFILAAAEVHQQHSEACFLCIGKDLGIRPQLEQLIKDSGLEQHVIFTGAVQRVPEILSLLDIQVSASYEEGFSNAILEGMASGKPMIATAVGGTPEAVEHNVTGILIPPRNVSALAQAITLLLGNPEFAGQLGHNARKHVEKHFPMQKMIGELETLYHKLLQKKQTSNLNNSYTAETQRRKG